MSTSHAPSTPSTHAYLYAGARSYTRCARSALAAQNNARDTPVRIVGHRWLVRSEGVASPKVIEGGGGGGRMGDHEILLPPGEAIRIQGVLDSSALRANAWGHYLVELAESAVREGGGEAFQVEIGALGLAETEGERVPKFE